MEANGSTARLAALAERLGCITEEDLALLGSVELETVRAWRHRGQGPTFQKVGNRALYPLAAVAQWLGQRAVPQRDWASARVPL